MTYSFSESKDHFSALTYMIALLNHLRLVLKKYSMEEQSISDLRNTEMFVKEKDFPTPFYSMICLVLKVHI